MRGFIDMEDALYDEVACEIDRLEPEVWNDEAMREVVENVAWIIALGIARGLITVSDLSESPDTVGTHPDQGELL